MCLKGVSDYETYQGHVQKTNRCVLPGRPTVGVFKLAFGVCKACNHSSSSDFAAAHEHKDGLSIPFGPQCVEIIIPAPLTSIAVRTQ